MPIYEYRCQDCGALTSVFTRRLDDGTPPVTCESCGSAKTSRAISAFAFPRSSGEGGSGERGTKDEGFGHEHGGMGGDFDFDDDF